MTTVSIETVVFCGKKYYNSNNLRMLQLFSMEYLYVKEMICLGYMKMVDLVVYIRVRRVKRLLKQLIMEDRYGHSIGCKYSM